MRIEELVPVSSLNTSLLKIILPRLGVKVDLDSYKDLIELILTTMQNSGKYETIQDVLADEEFVNSIVGYFSADQNVEGDSGSFILNENSIITCRHCGQMMSLKELSTKEMEE